METKFDRFSWNAIIEHKFEEQEISDDEIEQLKTFVDCFVIGTGRLKGESTEIIFKAVEDCAQVLFQIIHRCTYFMGKICFFISSQVHILNKIGL